MIASDRNPWFSKGVTTSASEWHAVELINKVLNVRLCCLLLWFLLLTNHFFVFFLDLCEFSCSSWGEQSHWKYSPSRIQASNLKSQPKPSQINNISKSRKHNQRHDRVTHGISGQGCQFWIHCSLNNCEPLISRQILYTTLPGTQYNSLTTDQQCFQFSCLRIQGHWVNLPSWQ